MATTNILGLFTSPEDYQAQQRVQDQSAALQYAGMTPIQQANYGIFSGAQQLGRGFGGLLGVQDPQLQRIRQRQEIMQTINPADPNSLMAGIQRASQTGDQELAMSLATYLREAEGNIALAAQRTAAANRERTQALPAGLQEGARIAEIERTLVTLPKDSTEYIALTAEKGRLQRSARAATATQSQKDAEAYANTVSGDPESKEWQNAYKERLDRLQLGADSVPKISGEAQKLIDAGYIPGSPAFVSMMDRVIEKGLADKPDRGVSFGTDREAIAAELYGKPFKDLTQAEKAKVNARKEAEENKKAESSASKLVMPGQTKEGPKGISGFRNEVIQSVKPFRDAVTGADNALVSINDSIKKGNFISFNAARTQLAKALGDSTLSRRDIEQAGGDPSIIGGLFDKASTLFTGTPTIDTQKKIQSTLKAIRKVALNKANAELAVQRKLGKRAGYTNEDMNDAFDFPEFKGGGGGNSGRVDFNSLPK